MMGNGRRSSRESPGARGFSLIELLTVVAILGVTALMAMAAWRAYYGRADVKNSARIISSTVQLARSMAVSRGITHFIVIDPLGNTVQIFADSSAPLNAFDAGDSVIVTQQLPSSVKLQLPPGTPSLPNPYGGTPITAAWQVPGPDTTAKWGTSLKGFLVTSTGLIESGEATPQVIDSAVFVLSDAGGTTAAVAIRGQFGTATAFYWLNQWIRIAG